MKTRMVRMDCLIAAHAAVCRGHGDLAARWLDAEQHAQYLLASGRLASSTRRLGTSDGLLLLPAGDGDREVDRAIMAAQDACMAYCESRCQEVQS